MIAHLVSSSDSERALFAAIADEKSSFIPKAQHSISVWKSSHETFGIGLSSNIEINVSLLVKELSRAPNAADAGFSFFNFGV
jgi:hypothetical protein